MSDTDDSNKSIQALREREAEITNEIALLSAQRGEVRRAISIVERNGQKKPELASVATDGGSM